MDKSGAYGSKAAEYWSRSLVGTTKLEHLGMMMILIGPTNNAMQHLSRVSTPLSSRLLLDPTHLQPQCGQPWINASAYSAQPSQ